MILDTTGLGDTLNKALRLLQRHTVAIIANIALECRTMLLKSNW